MENNNFATIPNNQSISLKDVYKQYWRCRDFEISHFWQRAIFLSVFMAGTFTGYCSILSAMIKHGEKFNTRCAVVLLLVSFVGIALSTLWIFMMKGSKAWYEQWENAITAFVEKFSPHDKEGVPQDPMLFEGNAGMFAGFRYHKLETFKKPKVSNCLFNTKGGAFSPSRINVMIGQLFLISWLMIALFHLFCLFGTCAIIGAVVFVSIIVFLIWLNSGPQSKTLEDLVDK